MHASNAESAISEIHILLERLNSISPEIAQEQEVNLTILRGSLTTALKKLETLVEVLPKPKVKPPSKRFFNSNTVWNDSSVISYDGTNFITTE